MVEDSNDKQLTHKDFYALGTVSQIYTGLSNYLLFHDYVSFSDIHKMDEWETLIESDIKTLKLEDSDLSDDEEDESDSDEDSEDMDVS